MADFMIHHRGIGQRLGNVGKKVAPLVSQLLGQSFVKHYCRYGSMYLALLQGMGAGAGWDIKGEARVAMRFLARETPVIFDVGAHTGAWSKQILGALDNRCVLYQFEPAKQNIRALRKMRAENVTLIEKAVSNKEGAATLYTTESASDISSLHERKESIFGHHRYAAEEIEVTTIDRVIDLYGIEQVDFMKMDIEGHELHALRGAYDALRAGKVRTFTFEFGSGNINSRTFFRDFWELLHPLGYSISRICPGALLLPVEHYYEDLEYFRNVTNYVATLED